MKEFIINFRVFNKKNQQRHEQRTYKRLASAEMWASKYHNQYNSQYNGRVYIDDITGDSTYIKWS